MHRRQFVSTALGSLASRLVGRSQKVGVRPNFVILCADDLGYGDLGCYGSRLKTPNIDSLAEQGTRFTQFCSSSSVCSPARAGLLTGRYSQRGFLPSVVVPNDPLGLRPTETTIARQLQSAGYRTAAVGKWHLGDQEGHLPNQHGFDEFLGIPYSHDMNPRPLLRNREVVSPRVPLEELTTLFTNAATEFIRRSPEKPFFLYLPYTAPHIPLVTAPRFRRLSRRGSYGDAMMELDWSVGEVLTALRETGQDSNTLVLFTSDNGPWFQGSPGQLKGRKGESYEGGYRVPLLARMPGTIPARRVVSSFATALDIFPTLARWADAGLPANPLDGVDIGPVLRAEDSELRRPPFLYFDYYGLQCIRSERYKLHLTRYNARPFTTPPAGGRLNLPLPNPELYDLVEDPSESFDLADQQTEVVAELKHQAEELLRTFPPHVEATYRDTMALPVEPTPSGAMPILRLSPQS